MPAELTAPLDPAVRVHRHPVTTLASGHELSVTVLELRGARPGPTVAITSGLHGDELFTALFGRLVLARLSQRQAELRGRVLVVPMANAPSFEWGTRATPNDHKDLNRVFPGAAGGTLSERLAHVLVERVVRGSDLVLDYHGEPDALNIRCTYARAGDGDYARRTRDLALRSGTPVVYAAPPSGATLAGCAEALGVLALTPELGGPLPEETYHLEYGWAELQNMLRDAGALPGEPEPSGTAQWLVGEVAHVRPATGGLFVPVVGLEALTAVLPAGAALGRVVSPYDFAELEVLRGPFPQNLLMVVRGRVSKVQPGDPAYIIGNAASAERRELA